MIVDNCPLKVLQYSRPSGSPLRNYFKNAIPFRLISSPFSHWPALATKRWDRGSSSGRPRRAARPWQPRTWSRTPSSGRRTSRWTRTQTWKMTRRTKLERPRSTIQRGSTSCRWRYWSRRSAAASVTMQIKFAGA